MSVLPSVSLPGSPFACLSVCTTCMHAAYHLHFVRFDIGDSCGQAVSDDAAASGAASYWRGGRVQAAEEPNSPAPIIEIETRWNEVRICLEPSLPCASVMAENRTVLFRSPCILMKAQGLRNKVFRILQNPPKWWCCHGTVGLREAGQRSVSRQSLSTLVSDRMMHIMALLRKMVNCK